MTRDHWKEHKEGCYRRWAFRIGHITGRIEEREPDGGTYYAKDFDPAKPKRYYAHLGYNGIWRKEPAFNMEDTSFPTPEAAAEAIEKAAVETAHEILRQLAIYRRIEEVIALNPIGLRLPKPEQRTLAFSPVHPVGHELRFRTIAGQFMPRAEDVTHWVDCEEVFKHVQPDPKIE
jgi:hypothetical protein